MWAKSVTVSPLKAQNPGIQICMADCMVCMVCMVYVAWFPRSKVVDGFDPYPTNIGTCGTSTILVSMVK